MDLEAWLRSLGLEQYVAAFRENAIDDTILPSLTAEDLKELGIRAVGHRRKLLDAIAALRAEATRATTDRPPMVDRPPRGIAERRQVTVMFGDLVGWTALSARTDPEDLREIISGYHQCINEIVHRFGGYVAKYFGDGVLVYFGYPEAHEDDAERAVRAGLELIAAVAAIPRSSLQMRVGIATGMVVVGDLIGSGQAQEHNVLGGTPNLGARLQEIADPNIVVIAEGTRKLLGNLFELQDLGARYLKGMAGPVRAWAVLRPSSVASRFEAMHGGSLAALVGREEELELLWRRWEKAKARKGQVVLLSGEAGIGKSRLTAAMSERIAPKPHTRLQYFCSPQHIDSPLSPVIGQIERASGLARDDTAKTKRDKLDSLLDQTSTSGRDAALIAELLSLPNDGHYPVLELSPQQRREGTLEALISQTTALAKSSPVLMIFEDVHWADPTSLELLGRTIGMMARHRVLLIITFRPEFKPPWIGQPHVTALTLNRLAPPEVGGLIDRIVGNKLLTESIRQDIIERTDGVPLFVEEMTNAVLEAGDPCAAEHAVAVTPSPALAIPATLHASLMARLDRLGPARELAQIGAAIGREISHALLAAVARKPEPELRSALDRLIQAGLLFAQGVPPHGSYLFKHALVQDAAYGMLLREQRRALHARIAETLETQFMEVADKQPHLLALHYTEAGQIDKAALLWGKAGQRSLERSALVEAAEQLTRALDQIATLRATPELRREQIRFQVALITPLLHVKGYAAPETKAAAEHALLLIEQAEALGERPEDPLLLFSALYGLWVANLVAFNGDVVCHLAAQFLALAEQQRATVPIMIGHRLVGMSLLHTGNIAESRMHLDHAIMLYDPAEHRPLATRFGQDVGVAVLSWRSLALWLLGYAEDALADTERALNIAREFDHAATLMYALTFVPWTHINCGNYAAAIAEADEDAALADEKGIVLWKAFGMLNQGQLLTLTDRAPDAIQMITSAITALRSTGTTGWMPLCLSCLATAYAALGRFDDAERCIDEAMTTIGTTQERWCEAEVNRTAGEIELLSSNPDAAKAEAYFERALAVARQQQAKSWELRAAMSMARLWRNHGRRQQAHDLLGTVYEWFTQGFDTLDLKEAKALLDALRG